MAKRSNLSESECFALIEAISDTLTSKSTESAIAEMVEQLRSSLGISCVNIREIISRPCTLRYTYESIDESGIPRRINETYTFEEKAWKEAMEVFSHGCYQYRADGTQSSPQLYVPAVEMPECLLQIPIYCAGEFLGILELLDFEEIREWSSCEMSALKVCINLIRRHLHPLHSTSGADHSRVDDDPLTGLMSFHAFTEQLDKKFSELKSDSVIAVGNMDLHHFKYINETYGYKKGDELLKLTAKAIIEEATKHSEIIICRAYADNFVTAATIPEFFAPYFENFVQEVNEKVREILQEHCPNVRIRIATGLFYVNNASMTAATAIANANLARKVAKRDNIRKPLVFSENMMEEIKYQEYLNNELPKAIENHWLKVYYQPKINCEDDSLCGAEALVRWQKPDGSFIYPDQFIPVFEKNGNIMDVDFYVYREVFRYIRGRLDAGLPVFPISMNVSRVHFRSDRIIPYIEELMQEYNMPPELVEFELTENIYMNNFSKADTFIKTFRSRGIRVSMDDFGSGYSSLNVISTLSIDALKIDKIFLKNGELNENDKTVIESMIAMAKRLGMKVICEGVETESQTLFLKQAKCDQIQGYYYGRPMDEESFNKFVGERLKK